MKSKSTHYINNDEFKELVTDYIRLNYNDKDYKNRAKKKKEENTEV